MTISRQKLSASLRKHGLAASKWSKGRVTWRASEGYDLVMFGFAGKLAEISYNVHVGFNGHDERARAKLANGIAQIEVALSAAGIPHQRDGEKVIVLDAR